LFNYLEKRKQIIEEASRVSQLEKENNKSKFFVGRILLQTRWKLDHNKQISRLISLSRCTFISYASFVKQIDKNCTWEKYGKRVQITKYNLGNVHLLLQIESNIYI